MPREKTDGILFLYCNFIFYVKLYAIDICSGLDASKKGLHFGKVCCMINTFSKQI